MAGSLGVVGAASDPALAHTGAVSGGDFRPAELAADTEGLLRR